MILKPEQERAIMHDDGELLVSASAGSGKTFTMIRRLIRLIVEGKARVNEILAVTFTEKAAAEMKEKLLKAVIKEIAAGNKSLKPQLNDIYSADITTVHAFCGRLLRTYFYQAGLPADFEIIDASRAAELKRRTIDSLFEELYGSDDEGFKLLVMRHAYKRKDDRLKQIVLSLYDFALSESEPERTLERALSVFGDEGFESIYHGYERLLCEKFAEFEELFNVYYRRAKAAEVEKYAEHLSVLSAVASSLKTDGFAAPETELPRTPSIRNNTPEVLALRGDISAAKKKFNEAITALRAVTDKDAEKDKLFACEAHTHALIAVVKKFIAAYAAVKLDESVVDFNDLEHFALKILLNDEVRDEVRNKYKYVFTDEYQDTNGVQERILSLVSNGNTYMVGDLKQSIYGFRGCNPVLFAEKYAKLSAEGKTVLLNSNFRSADAVIDGVNKVFDYAMTAQFSGVDYKGTSRLVRGGLYKEGSGEFSVEIFPVEKKKAETERPRIYNLLEETNETDSEASLGAYLAELIEREIGREIFDPTVGMRPVRYGDIAILTRSRGEKAEDVLRQLVAQGIPVSAESKKSIIEYAEIRALVDVLKLCDNFRQDVPLCSVMKNMFSFTDAELARIRLEGGKAVKAAAAEEAAIAAQANEQTTSAAAQANEQTTSAAAQANAQTSSAAAQANEQTTSAAVQAKNAKQRRAPTFWECFFACKDGGDEFGKKLTEFYDSVSRARLLGEQAGAGAMLETMITECGFDARTEVSRLGAQKIKRVRRFVARASLGGKRLTVREFLNLAENSVEEFTLAETGGEDTVKFLTIHSSKGLEYPVVYVIGIDKKFNMPDIRADILKDREHGFAVRNYDDTNKTFSDTVMRLYMKELIRHDLVREELRLLYVAMTRAGHTLRLIGRTSDFGGTGNAANADRFADFLPPDTPCNVNVSVPTGTDNINSRSVVIGRADERLSELIKSNLTFNYPYLSETLLPLKTSVTATLEREDDGTFVPILRDFADEPADTASGTAMHKFLENMDFTAVSAADEAARQSVAGALSSVERELLDIPALQTLLDKGFAAGLIGKRAYREQWFLVNCPASLANGTGTGEIMLQGVIDLLCVDGNDAVIYDYKYSGKTPAALKAKYTKQLQLYKYAVESALKITVKSAYLVSLKTADIIKIDI